MKPAIVVSAYNRPAALSRLLVSLDSAEYPLGEEVPLVISIDQAEHHPDVVQVAAAFSWRNGPKKIILQPRRLGPIDHFVACGELTRAFGAIVYLEDDLVVSPVFYPYAAQALAFFDHDERIGGISLYALWFNGYTQEPFAPLVDEVDHFFLQVPYTQGQAFTQKQWGGFRKWMDSNESREAATAPLHEAWSHFQEDEWFPHMARYLVATGRYFVYPRTSLSTGFGDVGTHFPKATPFFQAPLQLGKRSYNFKSFDRSFAVYDSFFELLPDRLRRFANVLAGYTFTLDLYATRTPMNIPTEYVLTSRPCRRAIFSYGNIMRPLEANVIHAVPGNELSFCRAEDVRWDWLATLRSRKSKADYFSRGRRTGRGTQLAFTLLHLWTMLIRPETGRARPER
ncbi:MAG: glycosyltransferase family 2 protein [Anaerolineaceae bacterium]|nr:glycosyltransferase family 2 protein [Anaerolineaceae bacterium]